MQISDEMIKKAVDAVSDDVDWVNGLFGSEFLLSADQVMRAALEAALSDIKPVAYASDYGLEQLSKRRNYCLSLVSRPEREYSQPIYAGLIGPDSSDASHD